MPILKGMALVTPSAALGDVSGLIGGSVVANSRSGLVLRKRPTYERPTSPDQAAASARMAAASRAWGELSYAQVEAWNAYARTIKHVNPVAGRRYSPAGFNVFVGLACKVLQIDPLAPIPTAPPLTPWPQEAVLVSARAEPGEVVFEASGPNSPGVVTELLLQRLPNIRRAAKSQYKTAGFVSFAAGDLEARVPVEAGAYVPAYRFVEAATGRALGVLGLARLEVE